MTDKTDKPVGGGGARNPRSLANLIPGAGTAAQEGNSRRMTHGGRSEALLANVEGETRELTDALAAAAPVREADGSVPAADTVAIERAARALKRWRSLASWLDLHGRLDGKGKVRDAARLELQAERQLATALDALGMTPESRSRLGLRLVTAAAAVEDAEAARAARERLDRRFEDAAPLAAAPASPDRDEHCEHAEDDQDHSEGHVDPDHDASDPDGGDDGPADDKRAVSHDPSLPEGPNA